MFSGNDETSCGKEAVRRMMGAVVAQTPVAGTGVALALVVKQFATNRGIFGCCAEMPRSFFPHEKGTPAC